MVNIRLSSLTYGPIHLERRIAGELTSYAIPASLGLEAIGAYGHILFQNFRTTGVDCYYGIYQMKGDLALDFQLQADELYLHIAIKNDFQYHVNGVGEIYLAEGQYNFGNVTEMNGSLFLEAEHEYHFMHLIIYPSLVNKLSLAFSSLQEWIESDLPGLFFPTHHWLSETMRVLIVDLLNNAELFESRQLDFYRDIKITELLFLALNSADKDADVPVKLSQRNTQLLYESKHILDSNYNQHITVSLIARQMGLNESKLKAGFKQLFGISMFEYLVMTRMQAARTLLLETDKPIKEIAGLTGYATKQSFINAFKKYFNETPGSYRREY